MHEDDQNAISESRYTPSSDDAGHAGTTDGQTADRWERFLGNPLVVVDISLLHQYTGNGDADGGRKNAVDEGKDADDGDDDNTARTSDPTTRTARAKTAEGASPRPLDETSRATTEDSDILRTVAANLRMLFDDTRVVVRGDRITLLLLENTLVAIRSRIKRLLDVSSASMAWPNMPDTVQPCAGYAYGLAQRQDDLQRLTALADERLRAVLSGEAASPSGAALDPSIPFDGHIPRHWHGDDRDLRTGLLSLDGMRERAPYFVRSADARGERLSCIYFGFVDLGIYNDQYGYDAGDVLLHETAAAVGDAFFGSLVGRISRTHFGVVCPTRFAVEQTLEVCENIGRHNGGDEARVTLKAGLYDLTPSSEPEDLSICLNKAQLAFERDLAFYDQPYAVYDEDLRVSQQTRQFIINNLERAIAAQDIVPAYQPVIRSITGEVACLEVLARWNDRELGSIPPSQFIPVCERAHLIHLLDTHIIRMAGRDWRKMVDEGKTPVALSINISRLDAELCDIVDVIDRSAIENDIPRSMVHIEITESAFSNMPEVLNRAMHELRNRGYSLWMDDYGSGYSSLETLSKNSFDAIKLDKSFALDVEDESRSDVVVSSTIDMAKQLGLQAICEGVETPERATFLRDIGCDFQQGFLYSRPLGLDDLRTKVESGELVIEDPSLKGYYDAASRVNPLSTNPFALSEPSTSAHRNEQDSLAIIELVDVGPHRQPADNADNPMDAGTHRPPAGNPADAGPHRPPADAASLRDIDVDKVPDHVKAQTSPFRFLLVNSAFSREIEPLGYDSPEQAAFAFITRQPTFTHRLGAMFKNNGNDGRTEIFEITFHSWSYRCRFRPLARHGNRIAILLSLHREELSESLSGEAGKDMLEQIAVPLENSCNEMFLIDPLHRTATLVIDNANSVERPFSGTVSLDEAMESLSRMVYAPSRKRFASFADLDSLVERLLASERRYLAEPFKMIARDGTYTWQSVLLIPARISDNDIVVLGLRDTDLSDIEASVEGISDNRLWQAYIDGIDLGVFWKDADRRFLGMNKRMMDYYNIKSLSDVVGKTDEDMGWHPDPRPFRDGEVSVLTTGKPIHHVPGTCLVRGEMRNIEASKMPIYENGRIVGLVGYFVDVTDRANPSDDQASSMHIDETTGCLNDSGLMASGSRYCALCEQAGTDAALVGVEIRDIGRLEDIYGDVLVIHAIKQIAQKLVDAFGVDGIIARVTHNRFSVCCRAADARDAQRIADRVSRQVSSITRVDGVAIEIETATAVGLRSEVENFEELYALVSRRLRDSLERTSTHGRSRVERVSREALLRSMRLLDRTFDIVRVVEPTDVLARGLNAAGDDLEPYRPCYRIWGRSHRCTNCISSKAISQRQPHVKYEQLNGEMCYFTSQPIMVDGKLLTLELGMVFKREEQNQASEALHAAKLSDQERQLLYQDTVTQAYNRRFYDDEVLMLTASKLMVLDVDNLAQVNETYGFRAGDLAIAHTVTALQQHTRDRDLVIHYAPSQILIVFDSTMSTEAFGTRLRQMRDSVQDVHIDEYPDLRLQAAIGAVDATGYVADLLAEAERQVETARHTDDRISLFVATRIGEDGSMTTGTGSPKAPSADADHADEKPDCVKDDDTDTPAAGGEDAGQKTLMQSQELFRTMLHAYTDILLIDYDADTITSFDPATGTPVSQRHDAMRFLLDYAEARIHPNDRLRFVAELKQLPRMIADPARRNGQLSALFHQRNEQGYYVATEIIATVPDGTDGSKALICLKEAAFTSVHTTDEGDVEDTGTATASSEKNGTVSASLGKADTATAGTATATPESMATAGVTPAAGSGAAAPVAPTPDTPFDAILTDTLASVLSEEDPDVSIQKFLENLGVNLQADRTYVVEENGSGLLSNTYEWCAPAVFPQQSSLQGIDDMFADILSELMEGSRCLIKDVSELRDVSPVLYEFMRLRNTRSFCIATLEVAGEPIGFFGIENPSDNIVMMDEPRLLITAQFISIMIRNRNVRAHLDYLSLRDSLTGILNRRGLEQYLRTLQPGLRLVLVYADINNLKRVNDTQGHEAGDQLIKESGQTMLQVAGRGHVYRLGGDEFAMSFELDQGDDETRPIREVRRAFDEKGISIALGYSTTTTPVSSAEILLSEADRGMYVNKQQMHNSRRCEEDA